MYVRFVIDRMDPRARCAQGVFCAAYDLWYDRPDLDDLWQMRELRRMLDWFNLYLDVPRRLAYRANRKAEISGVCWFRDTANRHISQARYLSWLVQELGVPVREVRSHHPGRILWQDRLQIVASAHLAR